MIFEKNYKYALLSILMVPLFTFGGAENAHAQDGKTKIELEASETSKDRQLIGETKKYDVYDLNDEIEKCASVVGRIPRLICYDNLSTSLGFVPPEEAEREEEILATYGFWEATKKRNPAGEEIFYLKNDSVEDIVSRSGLKRKATMVVQCKYGVTDFYLDWKSKLMPQGQVRRPDMVIMYQLDGERRKAVEWELSTDRNALFVPEPVDFLRNLQHYERLILTVTPHNESTQIIVHEIEGLKDGLQLIVRECYNQE